MTVRGCGKPVLLLHGYMSCKESFYYQIAALEQNGYKAIAPDMPAFGASGAPVSPWGVEEYAVWLNKFISLTSHGEADVIAHSFGARVLFKYSQLFGARFKSAVIVGGAGLVKPRSPQYMRQVKLYRRVKKLMPKFAEKHFGSEEYRALSPIMRESYKKIVNEDLRACAPYLTCRTLLVYGAEDKVTPPDEEGRAFNGLIKGSRLEIMRGGHFCFCEHAEEFNKILLGFLDGGKHYVENVYQS